MLKIQFTFYLFLLVCFTYPEAQKPNSSNNKLSIIISRKTKNWKKKKNLKASFYLEKFVQNYSGIRWLMLSRRFQSLERPLIQSFICGSTKSIGYTTISSRNINRSFQFKFWNFKFTSGNKSWYTKDVRGIGIVALTRTAQQYLNS